MNVQETRLHLRGESRFIDDQPLPENLLYGAVFVSPTAHGRLNGLNLKEAEKLPGVETIITAAAIPGENQIGSIFPDEPLLADQKLHYQGQPIALVIAQSPEIASAGAKAIQAEIEELEPVFDPRRAEAKDLLICPPRTFAAGDVEKTWQDCSLIVEGRVDSGGQEHLYLETQGSLALPTDNGGLKIISATQNPTSVQRLTARVTGLSMHRIEVEVHRLGGAFGGKEAQATAWAVMAGLAACTLKKPVKLVLRRGEDMRYTGKRHPYSSDYRLGLNEQGRMLAYEVTFYQNAGAAADLSSSILERTLFHAAGSYFIPNVKATGISCRTNLPPNTAFRGFGAPQAMFVMEAAIFKAAAAMGKDPSEIQKLNLLKNGDYFHYGMKVEHCQAESCWQETEKRYKSNKIKQEIRAFNRENRLVKKGMAFMPICFGISFTTIFLNQANALVHLYTDGSVSISTGAVEMGQGVNAKILQVASEIFSISPERIKIESTNTTRAANTSPTAASTGADLNGKATEFACRIILERLRRTAAAEQGHNDPGRITIEQEQVLDTGKRTDLDWEKLITIAYLKRVSLSAQAHYATPDIHFDKKKEKGLPFAYMVYGTAIIEVTLDCLRGIYQVDSVKVVHDFGRSLNPLIDLGQAEGAIVQGIGWLTLEELFYSDQGRLLTDSLTNYKVPDIHYTPREITIHFLENLNNPLGIFNSKAVGEPPFMYGIAVYWALIEAMQSFRPDIEIPYNSPLTPEKVLLTLYKKE